MKKTKIELIIRSTVHIVMSEPVTLFPVDFGSGCIIEYKDKEMLLTVAHVTDKAAGTCIATGQSAENKPAHLYSVGAMNYFEKYDITKYE